MFNKGVWSCQRGCGDRVGVGKMDRGKSRKSRGRSTGTTGVWTHPGGWTRGCRRKDEVLLGIV